MLSRHRRGHGDNGATLVESAVVTPVLLLFIFGIFEFGFAFRDYLAVANSTRDAAREASVAGNVLDADYRMLRAIDRASAALPDGAIEEIIIWEASGPNDSVPGGCLGAATGTDDVCNVYDSSDLNLPEANFGCQWTGNTPPDPVDSPDRFWCPGDRQVSIGSGLDYVGVYIRITHEYITGLFGDDVVFEDQMILKIEPQE